MPECWMCGKNGSVDPLERHHIFGGPNRKKSEKYGLVVYLCGNECHRLGKKAVHNNAESMKRLRKYGQELAMNKFGWDVDIFIEEFGKNYLD